MKYKTEEEISELIFELVQRFKVLSERFDYILEERENLKLILEELYKHLASKRLKEQNGQDIF